MHDFTDAEAFAELFDDPERDAWQRPDEVIALMQLRPGMIVADLGAGTGYFLSHLSRAVGPEGRVLALDVEPNMVEHMRARVAREGLANVEVRLVQADDPGLSDGAVQRILVINTWHHIANRADYAHKLARSLDAESSGGGAVVVVDFTAESPHGPPPPARLAPEVVVSELQGALHPHLLEEELPYQYVVLAWRSPPARTQVRPRG
jgi:ubiquinone/menaquinone biosynthesis C-methylase UbiE